MTNFSKLKVMLLISASGIDTPEKEINTLIATKLTAKLSLAMLNAGVRHQIVCPTLNKVDVADFIKVEELAAQRITKGGQDAVGLIVLVDVSKVDKPAEGEGNRVRKLTVIGDSDSEELGEAIIEGTNSALSKYGIEVLPAEFKKTTKNSMIVETKGTWFALKFSEQIVKGVNLEISEEDYLNKLATSLVGGMAQFVSK